MHARIFIVEDNRVILNALTEAIEELAHARVVGNAPSESAAKKWLTTHPADWDMAIVDLFLSEGSGLGVLSGSRGRDPSQAIVVLTNYPTQGMRERCMALGADAFFDKSTELDQITHYVQVKAKQKLDEYGN